MKEKILTKVFRIILGLGLVFFGANGFLQFVAPPEFSARAMEFMGAMFATGYLFQLTNIVFLLVALMLLTNKYVPFALVILAPVTLNVVLFHLFLDPASGMLGFAVGLLNIYLLIVNVDSYRPMFRK